MTTFIPPKKKLFELVIMAVMAGVFYFIHPSLDAVILFVFGFIWNWTASNDLSLLFENRRYRMSMVKLVVNLQNLILKPVEKFPEIVKRIVRILPAGIFWSLVIYLNESEMPWWATFVGSLAFEVMQFELNFIRKHKETSKESV